MTKRRIQLAKQFKLDFKGKTAAFVDYANMKSWLAQVADTFVNFKRFLKVEGLLYKQNKNPRRGS